MLVAALAICLPWGVWAVLNLPVGSSGVHEWLPEGRPERERYEAFVKSFGNDQVVLISWDGCRPNDPRLVEYQVQLGSDELFSSHVAKLESSDQLMRQLTEPPLGLGKLQAAGRLKGVMIGDDGTAAILARITANGVAKQNETIEMIQRAADRTPGLTRQELRIAGTVYEAFAVDAAAEASLKASTKFSNMFPAESKTNQDMAWMESHLGPIATVEVLLKFPANSTLNALERARWVSKVSTRLLEERSVGGVFSAVTFLPTWSDSATIVATAKRAVLRKEIQNALPNFQNQGLVAISDRVEVWRIIAKVSATSDEDYGQLTRIVANATNEILVDVPAEQLAPAEFTGLSPVMHETQVALLTDLGYSFVSAFLMITPVMMFIVRSIPGGLLLMLPNILPVTIAFGCMGWMGFDLDIAGILTASIALGIAVDDTLHFVCWYMDELRSGCSRQEAVTRTFHSCAAAMVHTTLISCVSMMPFLFAEFIPTQQFAKLMIVMLSGAIVGDLVLLPALLLSPVGKCIRPSKALPTAVPS